MLDLPEVLEVFEVFCLLEMRDLLELLCVLQGFLLLRFHALKTLNSTTLFTTNTTFREGDNGRRNVFFFFNLNIFTYVCPKST